MFYRKPIDLFTLHGDTVEALAIVSEWFGSARAAGRNPDGLDAVRPGEH